MIPDAAGHPATDELRHLAERFEASMNFLSPRHKLRNGDLGRMRTLTALAQKPEAEHLVEDLEARLHDLAVQRLTRTAPTAA